MTPACRDPRPRMNLATAMLLIAAFGLVLAATRYWGPGRWVLLLLVLSMGLLHRAVVAAVTRS